MSAEMFPEGWQTNHDAARASAGAVGARVAGLKDWPAEDVRLYQELVKVAAESTSTAKDFFCTLANDLRQFPPATPPNGWGDLYRYAVVASGATMDAEQTGWASSLSAQLTGTAVQTASEVKAVLSAAGGATVNAVNAGASLANSVATGKGGGKLALGVAAVLGLAWLMS